MLDHVRRGEPPVKAEQTDSPRAWTVAEAKARLSEILRLAEQEGPQQIGRRNTFVVVPKREWDQRSTPQKPLGQWLVENVPRGLELDLPDRRDEPEREIPFQGAEWDWD
ncbi:MAG: type II toxin-antitoxin system prevent-host-death family antitoxin [Holophagales bacterium]|nr:type II toxin-antitoxin system prevent-host-death family antitoxin [Holophagales bacterium]MYC11135.1 type II toxin-antitoxin system prevent-host-death family antitoxin [Holophagales bacterium]